MSQHQILYPLFAMAGLTFGILSWMVRLRFLAVRRGDLNPGYFKLNRGGKIPEYLAKVSQNFDNLLELPMLFYLVCLLLYVTQQADLIFLMAAWLFVAMRGFHSFIHTSSNHVRQRLIAFGAGAFILIFIWLRLLVHLLLA